MHGADRSSQHTQWHTANCMMIPTMLTYTSNPLNVPTISLSPFMITQILEPMHLSISSDGRRCDGLFCSVFPLGWIMMRRSQKEWWNEPQGRRNFRKKEASRQGPDGSILECDSHKCVFLKSCQCLQLPDSMDEYWLWFKDITWSFKQYFDFQSVMMYTTVPAGNAGNAERTLPFP